MTGLMRGWCHVFHIEENIGVAGFCGFARKFHFGNRVPSLIAMPVVQGTAVVFVSVSLVPPLAGLVISFWLTRRLRAALMNAAAVAAACGQCRFYRAPSAFCSRDLIHAIVYIRPMRDDVERTGCGDLRREVAYWLPEIPGVSSSVHIAT